MKLYHSTSDKKKILGKGGFSNRKSSFNYNRYIEWLLTNSYSMEQPYEFIGGYPGGARGVAPFMGLGIYCYDNLNDAQNHQANNEVIEIIYPDENTKFDFDDAEGIFEIYRLLEEIEKEICSNKNFDKDLKEGWRNLLVLLKLCIIEEFKNSQPSVGVIFHILRNYKKINELDLLIRSFYDKIRVGNKKKKYILIINHKKIVKID